MSTPERPPSLDPVAAARWAGQGVTLSASPWLHEEVASRMQERLARSERGLALLDPQLVLQRGYAWLVDEAGATVVDAAQVQTGQALRATLAKGQIGMIVKDITVD